MARLPNLRDIREKKQSIAIKIAGMERDLAKLRDEFRDYEAAERVWLTLSGGNEDDHDETDELPAILEEEADKKPLKRKPSGIPQMPEMILESLALAIEHGSPGLEPSGMLSYVQQKYWPDATPPDVASTAWRMWKMGRLAKPHKDSPIYTLPEKNMDAA
ncbi:MAG: hypothetical protein WA733_09530 [Methylocystis sp.]